MSACKETRTREINEKKTKIGRMKCENEMETGKEERGRKREEDGLLKTASLSWRPSGT